MKYAVVMIASFCENNPGSHRVYIMHRTLVDEDFELLGKALSKYSIDIISLKIDLSDIEPFLPVTSYWTYETYCTLKLADSLPEDVDRIIYFDTDIIVDKPVPELYEMDFDGNDIIAAEESNGGCTYDVIQDGQQALFAPYKGNFKYFNTGTMVLNVPQLKKNYSYETYRSLMEKWEYKMPACEQDVLNYVHFGKVKYIPWYKYNVFARDGCRDGFSYDRVKNGNETSIVHFVGMKPWNSMGLHYDLEKLWWDYARVTPIYVELMEEFIEDTLTNKTVENTLRSLNDEKNSLMDAFKKANELLIKITQK